MHEVSYATKAEEHIKESFAEGAGVVGAVAEKVWNSARRDEDDEREGFMDIVVMAAKIKANTIFRRILGHPR